MSAERAGERDTCGGVDSPCPGFTISILCSGPECDICSVLRVWGWPQSPVFVLLGPLQGPWELGIRTTVMNPGMWHLPAWHTGTSHTQRGDLSFLLCKMGRQCRMCKVETGGHVSENLTLVTSPVTGVDRKLLGDPWMFWGHPREGTRGRDRVLGALQSPAILWEEKGLQVWTVEIHTQQTCRVALLPPGGTRSQGPSEKALTPVGPPQ